MSTDQSRDSDPPRDGSRGGADAVAGGAGGDGGGDDPSEESAAGRRGRRDVVVPMRVYKTVTVFSTLIAVVAVVVGFVFIDAATLGVSVLRGVVVAALGLVGLSVPGDLLSAALAVVGLSAIAAGAAVYVLGTRFRAGGMGKSQEDSDEPSDNG